MIEIYIYTGNAVFEDNYNEEVRFVLEQCIKKLTSGIGFVSTDIYDSNGNVIGYIDRTEDK